MSFYLAFSFVTVIIAIISMGFADRYEEGKWFVGVVFITQAGYWVVKGAIHLYNL